jgi:hypothetical protein
MLYTPPLPAKPASAPGLRHRCRNPRCGLKLRRGPTDNLRAAFCTAKCFDSYFRHRCLVCERPIDRKSERRQLCGRAQCRKQFQRHRERFYPPRYQASVSSPNASRSADKTGLKSGSEGGRAFRQVAGPELGATSLRLASLPLDPDFAARIARANAHEVEARAKAKRKAERVAIVKRRYPLVNVLGGYRFPNAPVIDLSPIDPPPEWAITSRWAPTGVGADVPPIPEFLSRIPAAIPTRCSEEVTTAPGYDLVQRSEERKVANA